jgi:putative peptidoglycan lipid II flippase
VFAAANIGATFLFQWYIITELGAGAETDALFAGMALPQLVLSVVSLSLTQVLVPILAGESAEQFRSDLWGFLALVGGLFLVLASLFYVTAGLWVPVLVPGFAAEVQDLTVELTRIQLIGMVFAALNGVQVAAYHARQQFYWPELTPLVTAVVVFAVLLWALPKYGVEAAAWLATMRLVMQTGLLSINLGTPVRVNLRSYASLEAWKRIKPLLLGATYYKSDPLLERFLLSTASSGTLSIYYLAQQIFSAANQVLSKAMIAPLVPALSHLYKTGDVEEFRRLCRRKLAHIGVLCLMGAAIFAVFGEPLLALVLSYGRITVSDVSMLWWVLCCLGGAFVAGLAGQVLSSIFYIAGDTSTPTRMSVLTFTICIPVKIFSYIQFGVTGLAIVTSVHLVVNGAIMATLLRCKLSDHRELL